MFFSTKLFIIGLPSGHNDILLTRTEYSVPDVFNAAIRKNCQVEELIHNNKNHQLLVCYLIVH